MMATRMPGLPPCPPPLMGPSGPPLPPPPPPPPPVDMPPRPQHMQSFRPMFHPPCFRPPRHPMGPDHAKPPSFLHDNHGPPPPPPPFPLRVPMMRGRGGHLNRPPMPPMGLVGPWGAAGPRGNIIRNENVASFNNAANAPKLRGPQGSRPPNPPQPLPAKDQNNKRKATESTDDNSPTYFKNPALPKELIAKFGPLKCDLCCVTVNSTVQAKMHYSGKQHEKKVAAFLLNWSKETGQPVPKQSKEEIKSKPSTLDADALYCKVCDLALTSKQHADQHYMGRNHQRALNGHAPLKSGYFNAETGKWQRMPQAKYDPSGRFGIGEGFKQQNTDGTPATEGEAAPTPVPAPTPAKKGRFFCDLCQIMTTSQDQLDMHYNGAKHKKAVRAAGGPGVWTKPQQQPTPPPTPADSILASVIKGEEGKKMGVKDYSIYRTPSGQFYCQPCNITLNSEAQFAQHCESKKHKFKLATMKKPNIHKLRGGN